MVEAISTINTLEYDIHSEELISNQWFYTHSRTKIQYKPFKFYNYIVVPDSGVEVLYIDGDKYALINPAGFPFINLKLDPKGKVMRNNQHHTLFEAGFQTISKIVLASLDILRLSPEDYIRDLGIHNLDNVKCYVFEITNPNFYYDTYIIKGQEDIEDIAQRYNLCAYHLLSKNNLNFYNDVNQGDKILVSNSYAESFELWIDTKSYLPVMQKIFINDTLFEKYRFQNIIINPIFNKNEFDKEFEEYNF